MPRIQIFLTYKYGGKKSEPSIDAGSPLMKNANIIPSLEWKGISAIDTDREARNFFFLNSDVVKIHSQKEMNLIDSIIARLNDTLTNDIQKSDL